MATDIDPAVLQTLLDYDAQSGRLFWRERAARFFHDKSRCSAIGQAQQWNGQFAGKETFNGATKSGYLKGAIFGRTYLAHRVVWALVRGSWPQEIDHINGDRSDNRICNLRSVTTSENNRNRALSTLNKSGRIGVFWWEKYQVWRASIRTDGKQIHLGTFHSKAEAIAVRAAAEKRYGYHPNHGRAA